MFNLFEGDIRDRMKNSYRDPVGTFKCDQKWPMCAFNFSKKHVIPETFTFKSGDYIFINIPAIASFEWHPFTISSAPEQSNMISLHIRAVGSWTQRLYQYFEAEQKRLECKDTCHAPEANQATFHRTMTSVRRKVSRRRHSTSALKSHQKTDEFTDDHAVQIRKSFKHILYVTI